MSDVMTVHDLADYLKLHEMTVYKYLRNGLIPAKKIGWVWRATKEEIDQWMREQ